MRVLVSSLAAFLLSASSGLADSRIFIIANNADDYGIDQCLAKGQRCGVPLARAYCQQREFVEASAFRQVEADEITGSVPAPTGGTASYVAITCQR